MVIRRRPVSVVAACLGLGVPGLGSGRAASPGRAASGAVAAATAWRDGSLTAGTAAQASALAASSGRPVEVLQDRTDWAQAQCHRYTDPSVTRKSCAICLIPWPGEPLSCLQPQQLTPPLLGRVYRPAAHSTYGIPSYARSQPTSRPELYEFILEYIT